MSDKLRTDAASVSREYIEREMDRYTQKFVLADLMRDLERELDEAQEELNDKRKFCYAVEQALDGMKGDYVEIIKELRKDAERYRWLRGDKRGRSLSVSSLEWTGSAELSDAAVDAAIRKGEKESLTVAKRKPVPEFELIEKWEGE